MDLTVTVHDPSRCFEDGGTPLDYDFKFDDRPIVIEAQHDDDHTYENGIGGVIFLPRGGFIEIS